MDEDGQVKIHEHRKGGFFVVDSETGENIYPFDFGFACREDAIAWAEDEGYEVTNRDE